MTQSLQPSPYSGNETVLRIAALIKGLTPKEISDTVWEARLINAKDTQIRLEEIFDKKIQELADSGCVEEALINAYLVNKAGAIKAMLAQCVHWVKEIPNEPFRFKDDGKVNHLEWRNAHGW